MWFADIGVLGAWIAVGGWIVLIVVAHALPRFGRTGPAPRLLSPPARLPLLIGVGAVTVLFAAQAGVVDSVADRVDAGALDRSVWSWFVTHRAPAATALMRAVSTVGGTAGMAVLAAVGAVVLWRIHRRGEAVTVIVAATGAGLLVSGFKRLYGRTRPPEAERLTVETNAALPSGHSLGSVVVLGVLAAMVVLVTRRPARRALAVLVAVAAVAVIGVSRLYLGVHWVTDVVTGWLLGGAWLAACVTALVVSRTVSRRHDPAARR